MIKKLILMALVLLLIPIVYAPSTDSSDSSNTNEWTMLRRTLDGHGNYPTTIPKSLQFAYYINASPMTHLVANYPNIYWIEGNRVFSYNYITRSQTWNNTINGSASIAPAIYNNYFLVLDQNATLNILNLTNGSIIRQINHPNFPTSQPAAMRGTNGILVANNTIFLNNNDKLIFAYNITGSQKWNYSAGGASEAIFLARPSYRNGILYIGAGRDLYALNANNGTSLWTQTSGSVSVRHRIPLITNNFTVNSFGTTSSGSFDFEFFNLTTGTDLGTITWPSNTLSLDIPAVGSNNSITIRSSLGIITDNFGQGQSDVSVGDTGYFIANNMTLILLGTDRIHLMNRTLTNAETIRTYLLPDNHSINSTERTAGSFWEPIMINHTLFVVGNAFNNTPAILIFNVTINTTINSNITIPVIPKFGEQFRCQNNITTDEINNPYVNYTILVPSGGNRTTNQAGINYQTTRWNSSLTLVNQTGFWNCLVMTNGNDSITQLNRTWGFNITDTITYAPISFTQSMNRSQSVSTNISISHDGSQTGMNWTFNTSFNNNFTITFSPSLLTTNGSTNTTTATISTSANSETGSYSGDVRLIRTFDNRTTTIPFTLNVTISAPTIQTNITSPTSPKFGEQFRCQNNITAGQGDNVSYARYTISVPIEGNRTDNINGTNYLGNLWNSSLTLINQTGFWNCLVSTAGNGNTTQINRTWGFNITDTITYAPISFTQSMNRSQSVSTNITISHDGATQGMNWTFNSTFNNNFTITFSPSVLVSNGSINTTTATISTNANSEAGSYSGDIRLVRTFDNRTTTIPLTLNVTISAPTIQTNSTSPVIPKFGEQFRCQNNITAYSGDNVSSARYTFSVPIEGNRTSNTNGTLYLGQLWNSSLTLVNQTGFWNCLVSTIGNGNTTQVNRTWGFNITDTITYAPISFTQSMNRSQSVSTNITISHDGSQTGMNWTFNSSFDIGNTSLPRNFTITFSPSLLTSNGSTNTTTVTILANHSTGNVTYTGNIVARRGFDNRTTTIPLTLTITDNPGLISFVSSSNWVTSVASGSSVERTFTVNYTQGSALTGCTPKLSSITFGSFDPSSFNLSTIGITQNFTTTLSPTSTGTFLSTLSVNCTTSGAATETSNNPSVELTVTGGAGGGGGQASGGGGPALPPTFIGELIKTKTDIDKTFYYWPEGEIKDVIFIDTYAAITACTTDNPAIKCVIKTPTGVDIKFYYRNPAIGFTDSVNGSVNIGGQIKKANYRIINAKWLLWGLGAMAMLGLVGRFITKK